MFQRKGFFMKKIYAVNGSPRSNGNTAKILQKALAGAAGTGADTELFDLGKLNFSGCRSCFACKLKNGDSFGKCALRDDLTPVLDKIINCDGLIMASPIYFGAESGLYRNFLERLFFPLLAYRNPPESLAPKKFNIFFVYTMNIPESLIDVYGYKEHLEKSLEFPQLIFGSTRVKTLYVYDTYQFDDYSKYESSMFDAAHKLEVKKTLWQKYLQDAYDFGRELALY
ncbi:MAG: flavodoxin family protein [Lentisphaerae bacterium]|nr:flavodoxin family protein [Lentisphaerota bacterium]